MRKIATESPLQRSFLCTAAAIQSAEADLHDESQPFSDEPTRPAKYTIRGKTQLYKQFRINPCEFSVYAIQSHTQRIMLIQWIIYRIEKCLSRSLP